MVFHWGHHPHPSPPPPPPALGGPPGFRADKLDKQILLRVPRPSSLEKGQSPSMEYWQVAGKRLALQVIPPFDTQSLKPEIVAVKVLFGNLEVMNANGEWQLREVGATPKTSSSTEIIPGANVRTGKDGAVFMTVVLDENVATGPFSAMSQIQSEVIVPRELSGPGIGEVEIPFVKVQDTAWGNNEVTNYHFDGLEFYNATGFSIYFDDDSFEWICHTQAWTCGLYETGKFHLHNILNFCEIHMSLNNSGGTSGMRYFPDDYERPENFNELEVQREYVEKNTKLVVIPALYEQGPFWKIHPGYKFKPWVTQDDMVDYPWHSWIGSEFGKMGNPPIRPALNDVDQRYDVWLAFEVPSTRFQY